MKAVIPKLAFLLVFQLGKTANKKRIINLKTAPQNVACGISRGLAGETVKPPARGFVLQEVRSCWPQT
jgi:hypothetical protein